MKVLVLEADERTTKEGEVKYSMNVLGKFAVYGKTKMKTVDVSLTAIEYEKYSKLVDKDIEIDVIIPLPDFPLKLVQK